MRIVAILPAHDEAERIVDSVRAALSIPGIERVVVVDDASGDETASLAQSAGAEVVRLERNAGKGGALDAGLAHAGDPDIVLLLDADLGSTAAQGGRLLTPVLEGDADMAIAGFPKPKGKAGFGLVKRLARWGIGRLGGGGFVADAPLSGQRALNRSAIQAVTPFASGYGVEVAATVHALRAGLRLVEVPTTMTHAATGRDLAGFIHRGRQFVHVARALLVLMREADARARKPGA